MLARQLCSTWGTLPAVFCSSYFSNRVCFCLGQSLPVILLPLPSTLLEL
jgi:hypothetical protein